MSDTSPPVFNDRYQLVRHIARGGMAQVYLAQDLLLDRPVALKVLFPELSVDDNFVRRFRREAQAAANLTNPNIVSVYDWGQDNHTYFIVMEYVDGQTLSALIRQGPIDPAHAVSIGAEVAGALEFAHRHNVIHRYVKPGNVLLDTSGQVKVTDFGIARAAGTSEGLTQTGSVMGTATYFSPEQAQGYQVDARSDVYSLGIVLYEMATGRAPFTGENPVAIAYKHVREAPVPPRQVNPAIPAAYEAIVLKAMSKAVEDRYQTVGELQADLRRFRAGQPVAALTGRGSADPTRAGAATTRVDPAAATRVAAAAERTTVSPAYRRPATTDDDRGSHRWWWIAGTVVLLIIIAAVAYLLIHHKSVKTLTVPDVAGKPAATAEAQLTQTGFTNLRETTVASTTVASGQVISTAPAAGAKAKADAAIDLSVSGGPNVVTVPDVTGDDQAEATTKLQSAGFKVTTNHVTSSSVGDGLVVSTSPAANAKAAEGADITLNVSSGPGTVTIPSLVGESPTAAGNSLGNLGLKSTQLTEASTSVPDGEVTRTDPPAGTPVPVGSTVTVYVSSGPPQTSVPSVVGASAGSAESAIASAGLKYSVTSQAVTDPSQADTVLSQSPTGGTSVDSGTTVQLVVGSYTAPSTTTSTSTTTLAPATTSSSTTSTSTTTSTTTAPVSTASPTAASSASSP